MNEKLNLVEILKDCPKGTKLYSTVLGEVEFEGINDIIGPIIVTTDTGNAECFTADGKMYNYYNGECLLFPSKEQRDWSKFKTKKPKFDPKTWGEYCKLTKGSYSNYANATTNMVYKDRHTGAYNEFSTRERAKQFIAFGKLLQLRDYWVDDWKRNSDNIYVIYKNVIMVAVHNNDFPLAFPTREMAKRFKECFKDLIKEAYPLV